MNCLNSNTTTMLQKSMDFLWSKQTCIMDNLANAETPNYKAKYVTFEESLRDAIQAAADGTNPGPAIRQAIQDSTIELHEAEESTRMDDNGVNVTDQMVELVREGYQMQYVLNAINGGFSTLRMVITG